MDFTIELLQTIAIFAASLSILVFIHELGHFLAARLFGMRVEKFSVGFPPKVWGFKKGETEYQIGATPLGGYVKISGMIDESMDIEQMQGEPQPWEFRSKPVWQRSIVIVAGVVFNMILAFLIFAGTTFFNGKQVIPVEKVEGVYVMENSLLAEAGFKTGDKVVGVNGKEVAYFNDLISPDEITVENLEYTVIRDGQRMSIGIPPSFLDSLKTEPAFLNNPTITYPSMISYVQPGSPAEQAGLQAGDRIIAVDSAEVGFWLGLVEKIQSAEGELTFTVQRNGETLQIPVTPDPESRTVGIQAPSPEMIGVEYVSYGLFESLAEGANQTTEQTVAILQGFGRLFSGDISVRQNLGGFVAIANETKRATEAAGWAGFWGITALLSITLAIINILPIPVLDGGHLMFLLYEGITRHEPSDKVKIALQNIGFFLLVGLFIFVNLNDILRLFGI